MGPIQAALMTKIFYIYRDDGMLLSEAYLNEDEAEMQANITDITPQMEPGKVPWFVRAEGRWENREPVVSRMPPQSMRVYPSVGDQLDSLWHAMDSGEIPVASVFYNAIKMAKDANPKGQVIFEVGKMPGS